MKASLGTRPKTSAAQLVREASLLRDKADWVGAEQCYRRAVTTDPGSSVAWSEFGCLLMECRQFSEAAACFRRALHRTDGAPALDSDPHAAAEALRLLTEIAGDNPHWAAGQFSLGSEAERLKDYARARVHLTNALRLDPSRRAPIEALFARMHWMEHQWTEAIQAADRALAAHPDYYLALLVRARSLAALARMDEADECLRRALGIRPDRALHSDLLFEMNFLAGTTPETLYQEACRWNSLYAEPLSHRIRPHKNTADPDRRVRVGYVSADLHQHAMMRFFPPILENHDPSLFEVFVYSVGKQSDEWTEEVRNRARNVIVIDGDKLAEQVRADAIDILVDLSGHTMGSALLAFAEKPAPVAVSWLGVLATTGLSTIDYYIGGKHMPCPGTEPLFTEKVYRLPRIDSCCYRPSRKDIPVAPAPSIERGYVSFGCFNSPQKITRDVVRLWSAILHLAAGSRLLLKYKGMETEPIQSRFRAWFAQDGIAPERIFFAGASPIAEYLAGYAQIDIALDPFPYNGGTSTLDALWMGVPVVTLAGRLAVQAGGLSLLTAAGLQDFVAHTPEQYLKTALFLAAVVHKTPELRREIRQKLQVSELMDEPGLVRALEAAYRDIWRTWCRTRNEC